MAYIAPDYNKVNAILLAGYISPKDIYTTVLKKDYSIAQTILTVGLDSCKFGNLVTGLKYQTILIVNNPDGNALLKNDYSLSDINKIYTTLRKYNDYLNIGYPKIANINVAIDVFGFNANITSLPDIKNNSWIISPVGFYSQLFGTSKTYNKTQFLSGITLQDQARYGDKTTIDLYTRYINFNGINSAIFGSTSITYGIRRLLALGHDTLIIGDTWISHSPRYITPNGFDNNNFATHHQIGFRQTIYVDGFVVTAFGNRIIPESTTIYPQGFIADSGKPMVDFLHRHLYPKAFNGYQNTDIVSDDGVGLATIFNSDQYIEQVFDINSGLAPQPFGQWLNIENKDRVVGEIGWYATKFGYTQIDNNARLIEPISIQPLSLYKPYINHWLQRVVPEGIESPYMSSWHVVHNTAFIIKTIGADSQAFGVANVANTRRYYAVGNIEMASYGYHMIDYAIRYLEIESRYGITPPSVPLPTIDNYTRYIELQGIDSNGKWQSQVGNPALSIHFNVITPRWIDRQYLLWGDAKVRNVTPEIHINGHNSEEFGNISIRTQWRELQTFGNNCELFGRHEIAFRNRTIYLENNAINSFDIGKATVIRMGSPPYSLQYISLIGEQKEDGSFADGDGINLANNQMGIPSLNQTVIQLADMGIASLKFGEHSVTAGTIKIESGIYELLVGKPMVSLKIRKVEVVGIDETINENRMGKPRLSPHTIYAPYGDMATEQARHNHPLVNPWYVNEGEVFGNATATNQHRYITAWGIFENHFGIAELMLSRQYIIPKGWKGGNFGWHIIPYGTQTIEQYWDKDQESLQSFGMPIVSFPLYRGIQAIGVWGIHSQAFGYGEVQNKNRTIYATGSDMNVMGQGRWDDNPFMWQGLRVGELVKGDYGGDGMGLVSDNAFISLKIRNIEVQGFETFTMENNVSDFKKRMKVSRTEKPIVKTFAQMEGFEAIEFGKSQVKFGQYFIHPDGNSETYRQGIPS